MLYAILAGLAVGPLWLARMPRLKPAPGPVVVQSGQTVDVTVLVDGEAQSLPTLRPLPSPDSDNLVVAESSVQFAAPDALNRIHAELEQHPSIAVYPWQKSSERVETLSMMFVIWEAMTRSSRFAPTALRAYKPGHENDTPHVVLGGYVVAEKHRGWKESGGGFNVAALAYYVALAATVVYLVTHPGRAAVGLYVAAVWSLSLCLKQTGKFMRLGTWFYPVTLAFFAAANPRRKSVPNRPQDAGDPVQVRAGV